MIVKIPFLSLVQPAYLRLSSKAQAPAAPLLRLSHVRTSDPLPHRFRSPLSVRTTLQYIYPTLPVPQFLGQARSVFPIACHVHIQLSRIQPHLSVVLVLTGSNWISLTHTGYFSFHTDKLTTILQVRDRRSDIMRYWAAGESVSVASWDGSASRCPSCQWCMVMVCVLLSNL